MSSASLRPLGIGEVLDTAIRIVRRHFGAFARITVPIMVVLGLLQLLIVFVTLPEESDFFGATGYTTDDIQGTLDALRIFALVTFVVQLILTGASTKAAAEAYLGTKPDATDSLRLGLRRIWALVAVSILWVLAIVIGLFAVLLGAVFVVTVFAVAVPALMIEKLGPIAALGRSFRLTIKRFWPTLGTIALAFLLLMVLAFFVGMLSGLFSNTDTKSGVLTMVALSVLLSAAFSVPSVAFLTSLATVMYFDLRIRLEGYDLELLALETNATPSGSALGTTSTERPPWLAAGPGSDTSAPPPWQQ